MKTHGSGTAARHNETLKLFFANDCRWYRLPLEKDTAADSVDPRERNWGWTVLLSTTSFMSFDVKTREESSKGALTRSKRYPSPNFCHQSQPTNTAWFLQLYTKLGRSSCCLAFEVQLMSRASVPDARAQIVHFCREQADFWRSAFPSDCFIRLWCRNRRAAMCAHTGTLLLQTAAGLRMNLSASHLCPASAPFPPPPPPQINDCLSSFAPNHDQDAEAIENVYSLQKRKKKKRWKKCSFMLHKVACFHFDGIANQSDVIYVCFELEMSPGCDIGGGPTLLGEFTHCICSQSNRLETE